jgi:hypothetical protein
VKLGMNVVLCAVMAAMCIYVLRLYLSPLDGRSVEILHNNRSVKNM